MLSAWAQEGEGNDDSGEEREDDDGDDDDRSQYPYLLRSFALGASRRPIGAIVWPSWGHFGSLLGLLGALLGPLGALLGLSWAPLAALEAPWGHIGGHRSKKGIRNVASWGAHGALLGPS